jgi:two-component system, LytTR family, response regulator LytT
MITGFQYLALISKQKINLTNPKPKFKSMHLLIIEDEKASSEALEAILADIDPTLLVLARLKSVAEAVEWLKKYTADLIFLDINLGNESAFQIFEQIKVKTPIIFTTAYDKYALEAFKVNAIDYLLKPIKKEALRTALDKFKNLTNPMNIDFPALMQAMQNSRKDYHKRFLANSGEKIKSIPVEEVAYFFGQQKYVYLISHSKEQYIVDFTLEKLEDMLDPLLFFRINRQFIVSFESIQNMYPYPRGRVKIELNPPTKEDTVVSIDRAFDFKEWLNR